jgi:hypothetical protein
VTNWGATRGRDGAVRANSRGRLPLDLSNRSDIVADPFLGSGSTLIAAEKTGRVCRGVELDPLYVDVVVRRYEAATGNPAVLIETGEPFDLLAGLGQGKQRRSRVGSRGALGSINPWKRRRRHRTGACSVEVRGSNPLSSTWKSPRTARGSRHPQSLDYLVR